MAFDRRLIASLFCLVAFVGWLATSFPGNIPSANAEPPTHVQRLSDSFVSFTEDREDEEEDFVEDEDFSREDEGEDEDEDWGEEEELMEREQLYLELHRAELEKTFGELELMQQIAEIANDADTSAILAIVSTVDEIEGLHEKEHFLQACLTRSKSPAVKRVVMMHLAEVYGEMDQASKAIDMVLKLVEGD